MVVVNVMVDGNIVDLYMDNKLYEQLIKKVIPNIQKKDKDFVLIIDGGEGSGKSVLAQQIAKVLDPDFNLSRMCLTPTEFIGAVTHASKGNAVVFDEAFTGLSSRSSLSEVNRLITELMMEMRQRNLFVIIVVPTFFQLDRYAALFRAKGLIHVYTKNGKRGRWVYFNNKKKKILYLLGRKLYDYSKPKSRFRGRFLDRYTINEEEYRNKKRQALNKKDRSTKEQNTMAQRNALIIQLNKDLGMTNKEISEWLKKSNIILAQSSINDIIKRSKLVPADASP